MIAVPESREYLLGCLRSYIAQIQPLLGWEAPITVWDHPPHYGAFVASDGSNGLAVADEFFTLPESKQRHMIVDSLLAIMIDNAALDEETELLIEKLATFIAPHLPTLGGE